MFYRNADGTVGIRPNVPKPSGLSESQWRLMQNSEWDISNLRKIYPKLVKTVKLLVKLI